MSFHSASNISHGLLSGIAVINGVDSVKFQLVLNRVVQCILNSSDDFKPFSADEEERLSSTLNISQPELRLLLDCLTLILKQAIFNITKPALLQQQLTENLKLSEDKAETFVAVWTSEAKNIVGAVKHRSLYPRQVEGVSWLLNTAVSSCEHGPTMEPRAVIELKLHGDSRAETNMRLDLEQSQLYSFFETLETIQKRLDNLR